MLRYGLLNPPPIGGGATPTPTPTPTQATRTYDTSGTHFGLNTPAVDLTGGASNNTLGGSQPFGTLSSDIDGLDITLISLVNTGPSLLVIYANGSPIISWAVNTINMGGMPQVHSIPIRILSGVALSAAWATGGVSQACHVAVEPFKTSVAETITSWTRLGNTTGNLNTQGVSLSTAAAWGTVGTLGAGGAKALAVQAFTSVTGRTGGENYIIDIGTGASGSETLLLPAIAPRPRDTTSAINHVGSGVRRMDIPGGTRVAARAQTEAGTLTYPVNVQVMVGA